MIPCSDYPQPQVHATTDADDAERIRQTFEEFMRGADEAQSDPLAAELAQWQEAGNNAFWLVESALPEGNPLPTQGQIQVTTPPWATWTEGA